MTTAEDSQAAQGGPGASRAGGAHGHGAEGDGARSGTRRWAWAGSGGRARGWARAAAVGDRAGPALRVQRRRGRPLRAARDRNVRARPEPAILRQPAGIHLRAALSVRRSPTAEPSGVRHALAAHPADVYTLARVAAAVLGTLALWLLYATGARLFGRGVGLLAAAIEAVAFLPVFYCAPGAQRRADAGAADAVAAGQRGGTAQRPRARLSAGRASGWGWRARASTRPGSCSCPLARRERRRATCRASRAPAGARSVGSRSRGVAALVAFLIANPYALLDYADFHAELVHQSTLSAEAQGKLGAPQGGRAGLLPVDAHLGPRLGARAGGAGGRAERVVARARARLAARARAAAVSRVHGPAGPLLRSLAAADLPDPVLARGAVRGVDRSCAGESAPATCRAPRAAAWVCRRGRCSSRCCSRRGSSTASIPGKCSRARTRAT